MLRAQQQIIFNAFLSCVFLCSLVVGVLPVVPTPRVQAATDPERCKVDVTLLVDNSGSMDDNGSDKVLQGEPGRPGLTDRLRSYFKSHSDRGDRAALFTFSYLESNWDGEGIPDDWYQGFAKRHVRYTASSSIALALSRTEGLNFNADKSNIGIGIRAASNYARENSDPDRTQFIFVIGDAQTSDIPQDIRDRIRLDVSQYNIKYFTFALRQNMNVEPFRTIAELGTDDGRPRFYRAHGFSDELAQDMDEDCEPPNPEISLQFCAQDRDTGVRIPNAWITDTSAIKFFTDGAPGVHAGIDGCTNPAAVDHAKLTAAQSYKVGGEAAHLDYDLRIQNWTYLGQRGQKVIIKLDKECLTCDPSKIVNVTKRSNPAVLKSTETQTAVEIDFSVSLNGGKSVKDVVLHEELDAFMVFDSAPNFRLVKPDGSESALSGTPDPARKIVKLNLDPLTVAGLYTVKFAARYTGPADNQIHPIDVSVPQTCDKPNDADRQGSRFVFTKGDGKPGCEEIEKGQIRQSDANKIVLGSDVLFGNKALTLNKQLALGVNGSLIITGQNVSGDTGDSIVFDRNNIPTGGKLSWNALKTNVQSVVNRWINTKAVRVWSCPGGTLTIGNPNVLTPLYLNTSSEPGKDKTPLKQPTAGASLPRFTMWQLKNPNATGANTGCTIDFRGPVAVYGTGTLVNKGGQAFFRGKIAPESNQNQARYALGYVSTKEPGVADSGKVVVYDQSELTGAIIYTEGTLEIGTADPLVPDAVTGERKHKATFIGQSMKFPALNALRSTIVLDVFAGRNAFPPFVQTYLPQSEAAP